jgi:hypothetical protein
MANENWVQMQPKVAAAFAELKKNGIKAEENCGVTLSDGIAEIITDPGDFKGYAFYHEQDLETAEELGELTVAYGSMDDNATDEEIVAVGKAVRQALEAQGLYVEWDETSHSRLVVYLSQAAKEGQENGEAPTEAVEYDVESLKPKVEAAAAALKTAGVDVVSVEEYQKLEESGNTAEARGNAQGKPVVKMPTFSFLDMFPDEDSFYLNGAPEAARLQTAEAIKKELEKQGLTVNKTNQIAITFKVPRKTT